MAIAANLGYPRIGLKRELKRGLENYWAGTISKEDLITTGKSIRKDNWLLQKEIGIQQIPVNDFSFYDHVLDTSVLLGVIPDRFQYQFVNDDLDQYFAMARGGRRDQDYPMEMTKWFNTNYHYIVPEISSNTEFVLHPLKLISEINEAKSYAVNPRPVLLGPVSFLLLSKSPDQTFKPLAKLHELVSIYSKLLSLLADMEVNWVQIDEPILSTDLTGETINELRKVYQEFGDLNKKPNILLTSYFSSIGENLPLVFTLPVEGVHLDLINAPEQLESALQLIDDKNFLSMGLVDGRNVWKTNLSNSLQQIARAIDAIGNDQLMISPSCSLLHVPQDINLETGMNPQVKSWLAFARQKLEEIANLTQMTNAGLDLIHFEGLESSKVIKDRSNSPLLHNSSVKSRLKAINNGALMRKSEFKIRRRIQQDKYNFPSLPTTTIGSFPQTEQVRKNRNHVSKGQISKKQYEESIRQEIKHTIKFQESIGIDVLVHGEFERNDMVQFFAEQLSGFAFTEHGWVQSFGSRFVRPPIIYGDVSRPSPMSVNWSTFAQSLTKKPIKGMLTGPVTILNWSFVRDDQPRSDTCRQIALAIQEEVLDLEKAGIGIIQIDEPALREGLPLHKSEWDDYLNWAVECFKITNYKVRDETQIHTHMCYSEFNDIIQSIAQLDADVISIEATRSKMELLDSFSNFKYPNDIGPGIYDIHSPRIPTREEMMTLLKRALAVIPPCQLWVNPDCGLKTRQWTEIEPALRNMVSAAQELRKLT